MHQAKSKIQNPKSKIAIIGGGISGLSAAFRLQELQAEKQFDGDFCLFEASLRLGGSIRTIERDGFLLESGADSFLSEKPAVVDLAKRLGIERQLIETNEDNRRSFIVCGGKLRAVPAGFRLIAPADVSAFFASDLMSTLGKVRLANERFVPPAPPADDETLASFIRRRFGNEALERIAQPMFAGIYTADPEKLSMRATQPRFLELEQKYGSVIRGLEEAAKLSQAANLTRLQSAILKQSPVSGMSGARYNLFLSLERGMQQLIDRLSVQLPAANVRLQTSVRALNFDWSTKRWTIETADNDFLTAEAVCLALPAHAIAKLLNQQFPRIAAELAAIEHASTATVNFGFKREQIKHPLDGFGFVVPFVEKRTLLACTFSSVKFPDRAPKDQVLLRAFVGGALQPEMFALDDKEMIKGTAKDLRELLGTKGNPIFSHVERWQAAMPQYAIGHLARVERIKNLLLEIPSLTFATTAIDGVGIPDSVRRAEAAIEQIAGDFSKTQFLSRSQKS